MTTIVKATVVAVLAIIAACNTKAQDTLLVKNILIDNTAITSGRSAQFNAANPIGGLPNALITSSTGSTVNGPVTSGINGPSGSISLSLAGNGITANVAYTVSYTLSIAADGSVMINYTVWDGFLSFSGSMPSGINASDLSSHTGTGSGSSSASNTSPTQPSGTGSVPLSYDSGTGYITVGESVVIDGSDGSLVSGSDYIICIDAWVGTANYGSYVYTISSGDTCASIAGDCGCSETSIEAAIVVLGYDPNDLSSAVGQEITIVSGTY
jgi:hypothetical protein